MGIKAIDLNPIASYGPTPTTPTSKDVVSKFFAINRTDTTSTIKCVLPADATIIAIRLYSTAVSNAGTTATVAIGNATTPNFYVTATDVKTNAGTISITSGLSNIFNLENIPLGATDIQISGVYAETGTASTSGGPYYVTIEYVR